MTDDTTVQTLRALLLDWFDANRRDLPWRHTGDPYRIWVSEIMLQQTQVDRVVAYYEAFIEAFPTVDALADAPLDGVLKLWEGLGYYSRARNLHAAAARVVAEHGGCFPRDMDHALALPGVGEYVAGAVLSMAYGLQVPAVDANVRRVLARLFSVAGDPTRGAAKARIARVAADAVRGDRPGDFNQALMELGALVCVAGDPACLLCPLTSICEAREKGIQAQIPPPGRSTTIQQSAAAAVIEREGRYLLARRPLNGFWGGLWEFPNCISQNMPHPRVALAQWLAEHLGLHVSVGETLTRLQYGIMNRRVELSAYVCVRTGGEAVPTEHIETRWVHVDELDALAMPSPHRAVADVLIRAGSRP